MSRPLYCSFCAAEHGTEAEYLVAGPGVYICDQCVDQAARIIRERRAEDAIKKPHLRQSTSPQPSE